MVGSDGLTDMVDDATIGAELRRRALDDATCRDLVVLALEGGGGGRDNVIVIVIVADDRVPDEA